MSFVAYTLVELTSITNCKSMALVLLNGTLVNGPLILYKPPLIIAVSGFGFNNLSIQYAQSKHNCSFLIFVTRGLFRERNDSISSSLPQLEQVINVWAMYKDDSVICSMIM